MNGQWCRALGWCALLCLAAPARPATAEELLSVEDAVAIALAENPSLAEMRTRSQALAQVPRQVSVLPDPVLSVNALNFPTDSFDYQQEAMTQVQLGIS